VQLKNYNLVKMSRNQMSRVELARVAGYQLPPSGMALRITGLVQRRMLAEALTVVARRHCALRNFSPLSLPRCTGASMSPADAEWPLTFVDARDVTIEDTGVFERLYEPFNLEQPPLLRAALIRLSTEDWLLGLAVDHTNFDGGSIAALSRDLAFVWQSLSRGAKAVDLSSPVVPYDRFVCWEEDWLSRRGEEAFAFWAPQWRATGLFPGVPLPRRPATNDDHELGRKWERILRLEQIEDVGTRLCAGYFTPFMLLSAALFKAIAEHSCAPGLSLLFPFSNRLMKGSRDGVGYYSNRLLLRNPLAEGRSLGSIAIAVRSNTLSALKYGSLPYGLVRERLFAKEPTSEQESLYLNMLEAGQEYEIPGGKARVESIDRAEDFGFYPGLTVNCTIDRAKATVDVCCAYGSRFYREDDVNAFMAEVVANLTVAQ
jgi:Condensation domain